VDQLTEKSQQIRIETSSGLTEEEISRMKEEALQYAFEDQELRQKADQINQACNQIAETEILMNSVGNTISANQKATIELALAELKSVYKDENSDGLAVAMMELSRVCQLAGEEWIE
jgi:molecular chaperone DnaK